MFNMNKKVKAFIDHQNRVFIALNSDYAQSLYKNCSTTEYDDFFELLDHAHELNYQVEKL